jgi:hypothetical protein
MKVSRTHQQLVTRSPRRSVSLHFGDYQVTVKVRKPVPERNVSLKFLYR